MQQGGNNRIVIIGAGLSSHALLDEIFKTKDIINAGAEIVLITNKEYYENTTASVRYLVQPDFFVTQSILLRELYPWVKVIVGEARSIRPDNTVLVHLLAPHADLPANAEVNDNQLILPFNMAVVATGSSNPGFKGSAMSLEQRREEIRAFAEHVRASNNVLVVGGGATGIEIAGEIRHLYPTKQVTIVHKEHLLLSARSPAGTRSQVTEGVRRTGIILALGQTIDAHLHPAGTGSHTYTTSTGQAFTADMIIRASGNTSYSSELFRLHFAQEIANDGTVRITPQYQLQGKPNIFVMGDIIHNPDIGKNALNLRGQIATVRRNLLAQLRSKKLVDGPRSGKHVPPVVVVSPNLGFFTLIPFFGHISRRKLWSDMKTNMWLKTGFHQK